MGSLSSKLGTPSDHRSQIGDVGLFAIGFAAKLIAMMTLWTVRRGYVLMLGLLLALGMILSAVQAGTMAAGMVSSQPMSAQQMSAAGMHDCNACKSAPADAKSMVCDAACAAAVIAVMPQFGVPAVQLPVARPLVQSPMLLGWTASPNPHPPQRVALI